MALCSMFLIAGPEQLVKRSAPSPAVPAATVLGDVLGLSLWVWILG